MDRNTQCESDLSSRLTSRRQWLAGLGALTLGIAGLSAGVFSSDAQAQTAPGATGSPAAAGGAPRLLVVGDSLSAEYGIVRGTGWVPLLQERLKKNGYPYQVVNASISGDTTSGGVSRMPSLLTQHKPEVVVVELGANDALRGLALSMTERNLDKLVGDAKQSGAKVLVAGIQIPPNYGRDYTERFNAIFGKVAKTHQAALVPFLMEGIATDRDMFQADGIHPVSAAQPKLLDNVWARLEPLLKR
ncbi:arylesterase [Pigmentiphaga aceris]|uniref:Arylesterase n=1 Tax=Pigmentiphaga aceris TaxID=1940612 RepID=A0A5C0B244_9BURK|nr:arylesterase [Pigmentiphaga aceris]QEI06831.1 arylesterase [Pigmentiphaga aceris]